MRFGDVGQRGFAEDYVQYRYIRSENAEAVNKGEEKDLSKLGVRAIDDLTLRVKLTRPYLKHGDVAGEHLGQLYGFLQSSSAWWFAAT